MTAETADDDYLLELLNTTPVADGSPVDELADPDSRPPLAARPRRHGDGTGVAPPPGGA